MDVRADDAGGRGWKLTPFRWILVVVALGCLVIPSAWFTWWRAGDVVAEATFDPGIAPFRIEVRSVPVAVTDSRHFIISLYRGQYVVTSFRAFWPGYTPKRVTISWNCIDHFEVTFDDQYQAICDWHWGSSATWTMRSPQGGVQPGLSPYYFTPRNPVPANCPKVSPT